MNRKVWIAQRMDVDTSCSYVRFNYTNDITVLTNSKALNEFIFNRTTSVRDESISDLIRTDDNADNFSIQYNYHWSHVPYGSPEGTRPQKRITPVKYIFKRDYVNQR